MPYFKIETNQAVDELKADMLVEHASSFLAGLLGKPEKFIMVSCNFGRSMLFGGNNEPAAFVQIKNIGLDGRRCGEYSKAVCEFLEAEIGVSPDRVYIALPISMGRCSGGTNPCSDVFPAGGPFALLKDEECLFTQSQAKNRGTEVLL